MSPLEITGVVLSIGMLMVLVWVFRTHKVN